MTDGVTTGEAAFTALGDDVRSALSERGFSTPTEPQRLAIPPLAAGKGRSRHRPHGDREDGDGDVAGVRPASLGKTGSASARCTSRRCGRSTATCASGWTGGATPSTCASTSATATTDYQRQKQANNPPDVLVTTPKRSRRC